MQKGLRKQLRGFNSCTCNVLLLFIPFSASPSRRHLYPRARPAAPPAETASPNHGRTPGRSLVWTPETHSPLTCWRRDSHRLQQTSSCLADSTDISLDTVTDLDTEEIHRNGTVYTVLDNASVILILTCHWLPGVFGIKFHVRLIPADLLIMKGKLWETSLQLSDHEV